MALIENQTIEMCKIAIRQNYNLLRYVNKENQTDNALKYIPVEKRTYEICKLAVQQNRYALRYIKDKSIKNKLKNL